MKAVLKFPGILYLSEQLSAFQSEFKYPKSHSRLVAENFYLLPSYIVLDGRIILKWIIKNRDGAWTGLMWFMIGTGGWVL